MVGNGQRLYVASFVLDKACVRWTIGNGHVLQRTLAATITDGTVQWVIRKNQLQDAVLCLLDIRGCGLDNHPICGGNRTGCHDGCSALTKHFQLDARKTHSTCANAGQPWMVAKIGNVRTCRKRRLNNQGTLWNRDRLSIDNQTYHRDTGILRSLCVSNHFVDISAFGWSLWPVRAVLR